MPATPAAAGGPRPTPPKLNPVRIPIIEEPVEERTQDFREVLHAYSRDDAILEAKRCIQCRRPWCVEACPITQDCREYLRLIAEDNFDEAARVTARDNPLATCLCKVCYRYCEDACVVKKKGVPVAIRHLKRAALELGTKEIVYVPAAPKLQRVAVVGAGPAGIMMAWELGVRGYAVTVFEQEPILGGLMQTIPPYRMTDADLDEDLRRFKDLDVTFVRDRKIGMDAPPEALLQEGYQVVFLALGTSLHRVMGIPGEELPGVFPALEMLKRIDRGESVALGQNILVVGGGDVAMDAVRSCLRLSRGGTVTLVYRRGREDMPADSEEVEGAEHEGVRFLFRKAPVRALGDGHVSGLVVQQVELGPPDSSGRRSPVLVPGSEETLPCDTLVVAVGQKADLRGMGPELGLRISSQGWPEGPNPGFSTPIPGVFAAGGRSVVYAMGAAQEAADAIDGYLARLRGEEPKPRPDALGGPGSFQLPAGYTKPIRY